MPSRSRKKIKGQARKAKAKAAAAKADNNNAELQKYSFTIGDGTVSMKPKSLNCNHGEPYTMPDVCAHFIDTFFKSFFTLEQRSEQISIHTSLSGMVGSVILALEATENKFPEALNNYYREFVKKNIICNGVEYLLGERASPQLSIACAATLMLIDSYDPSSPVEAGTFDERDANKLLTNGDILNGCQRSLVKFFVNRTPCNCLDELYSQLRSTTPKMGHCFSCHKTKERTTMFVCTGCERVTYCSKLCQLADVPEHKEYCKRIQAGHV